MAAPIIGAILGIGNKIMGRFNWDRKSIRRNKLEKLEKQEKDLLSKDCTPALGNKLARVRLQISKLRREAKND